MHWSRTLILPSASSNARMWITFSCCCFSSPLHNPCCSSFCQSQGVFLQKVPPFVLFHDSEYPRTSHSKKKTRRVQTSDFDVIIVCVKHA